MEFGWSSMISGFISHCRYYYAQLITLLRKQIAQCDLCGSKCHNEMIICPFCLDDISHFKFDLPDYNLLNFPTVRRALPDAKFDHLLVVAPYVWPYNKWLYQFKYQGKIDLVNTLSTMMQNRLRAFLSSHSNQNFIILSVPLHINKWQKRGYNQAHILAENIAIGLNIPHAPLALIRQKETLSQVGTSGKQRRQNLRGAFVLNEEVQLSMKHVILIDDVVTTGATVNEICRLLRKSGIASITVVSLCLTLPEH